MFKKQAFMYLMRSKKIAKILLLLAAMQPIMIHAMLLQAGRTALVAGRRTLSSTGVSTLGSISSNRSLQSFAAAGISKMHNRSIFADTSRVEVQANTVYDAKSSEHAYQKYQSERENDFNRSRGFNYKPFVSGVFASTALYVYITIEAKDKCADASFNCEASGLSRSDSEESQLGSTQVEPYSYTINLMWINRKFEKNQQYIHPSKTWKELEQNLLNAACEWAESNPEATVNVWYDSAFLTPEAIRNTQDAIEARVQTSTDSGRACITLKDVRMLSEPNEHPDIFSDKTPVYFRADILRVIAALDTLKQSDQRTYFVYADLDVKPMAKDELLDEKTLKNLEFFGILMDRENTYRGYENSFFILGNHKTNLIKAMQIVLISLNIQRAYNALQGNLINPERPGELPLAVLTEAIYNSYPKMFEYYCHLEGHGELLVGQKRPSSSESFSDASYSFADHGYSPFGLRCTTGNEFGFIFTLTNDSLIKSGRQSMQGCYIPTKKVTRPPAQLDYSFALPDSERPLLSKKAKAMLVCGASASIVAGVAWWFFKN